MTVATSEIGFWQALVLLLVWVPVVMAWAFAFFDVFRRDDITGASKALWLVVVAFLPLLGTILYLVFRPTGAARHEPPVPDRSGGRFHWQYSRTTPGTLHALQVLSELHDAGKLTDAEFAQEKRKLLAA